jgi:hypothetical protein
MNKTEIADATSKVVDMAQARAQQAAIPGVTAIEPVAAPTERGALVYGRAQVAALVIVEGGNVASIPPQVFASVREAGEGGGIVALVGPETDLSSVQDAVLFSQAYALRAALTRLVAAIENDETTPTEEVAAVKNAKEVLEASTPQFMRLEREHGSAEERLAAARAGYDPAQNPPTAGILSEHARTVVQGDAAPSSSDPV